MDLISKEYGWSDDVILDLPLCRVRQIQANIEIRKREEYKIKTGIVEWQTKVLAGFIVGTAQIDDKGKSQLSNSIDDLSIGPKKLTIKKIYEQMGVAPEHMDLDPNDPEFIVLYGSVKAFQTAGDNEDRMKNIRLYE